MKNIRIMISLISFKRRQCALLITITYNQNITEINPKEKKGASHPIESVGSAYMGWMNTRATLSSGRAGCHEGPRPCK